ncbi:putative methionyl-tRNA synthetase [Hordeum vulgare]|nr:putative methionyl-tRNA synthetase [Hordeum vulgare]
MTFDERNMVDPDFASIHMDRGKKAMVNRWSTIQKACNKCHGIVEEVAALPESGANVKGHMHRMFAMYHTDNEDQEFRFLHVFSRIDLCEKWREVWLALDKDKETYNLDALTPAAAKGSPDGTKKRGRRGTRRPFPNGCRLRSSNVSPTSSAVLPGGRRNPTRGDANTDSDHHGDHGDHNRECNGDHNGVDPHRAHTDREPDLADDQQPDDADDELDYGDDDPSPA